MPADPHIPSSLINSFVFDGEAILYIVIVLLLLCFSAAFSAAETAYSSLNEIRVKQLAKSNRKGAEAARRVYNLYKQYSQLLATILVCNNLVNLAASSIVTFFFTTKLGLGSEGVLWSTIAVSILVIVFGEILPKNIAKLYPEKIATISAIPLRVIIFIFYPFTILFSKVNDKMEERADEGQERVTATEDELIEIVETIEKEGVLEQGESEIIKSAINFDDKTISTCMIDKSQVLFVYDTISFESLVKVISSCPYSRIPVYSSSKKQVMGIIRQRDVFDVLSKNDPNYKYNINKLMRSANVVSYRRNLPFALEKMQRQKSHMLIVVDNIREKEFLGILTLEDVLEELVGEIYDESDKLPKEVVEIGHHIFEVSGDALIEDFFDDHLDDTDYPRTKSILMKDWVKKLAKGKKLKVDMVLTYDNLTIKITKLDENGQIISLEVQQFTKQDDDDLD